MKYILLLFIAVSCSCYNYVQSEKVTTEEIENLVQELKKELSNVEENKNKDIGPNKYHFSSSYMNGKRSEEQYPISSMYMNGKRSKEQYPISSMYMNGKRSKDQHPVLKIYTKGGKRSKAVFYGGRPGKRAQDEKPFFHLGKREETADELLGPFIDTVVDEGDKDDQPAIHDHTDENNMKQTSSRKRDLANQPPAIFGAFGKRAAQPWAYYGKRDLAAQPWAYYGKRDLTNQPPFGGGKREVHPWSGKRNVHPWSGKRDVHPWSGKRDVHPWSGKRNVHPWSGKRDTHPWSGKRDVHPWSGKRDTHPWSGKRDVHPWSGKRDVHPWSGKRVVHPWSGKKEIHPWSGKRDVQPWMSAFGKRDNNNEESQMWLGSFGKKGNDLRDLPYLLAKDAKPYFHFDIHQRDSTKDSNGRKTSK